MFTSCFGSIWQRMSWHLVYVDEAVDQYQEWGMRINLVKEKEKSYTEDLMRKEHGGCDGGQRIITSRLFRQTKMETRMRYKLPIVRIIIVILVIDAGGCGRVAIAA